MKAYYDIALGRIKAGVEGATVLLFERKLNKKLVTSRELATYTPEISRKPL